MSNLVLIFACLLIGLLLRQTGRLPSTSSQAFNAFVIWVSVPAIILLQIPRLLSSTQLTWDLAIPISMPWLTFILSFLIFTWIGKRLRWNAAKTGALVLTAGLGNTSFVGIPVLEALLGPKSTPFVLILDQLGSFLTLSFLGVIYASTYSPSKDGQKVSLRKILGSIISFPPFVALWGAVVFWALGLEWSPLAEDVLAKLAATLVPLALIAVGFQLRLNPAILKKQSLPVTLGLSYKLILAPAFFLVLYVYILGSRSFSTHVTLLEAAMAPMITAGVVAEEFGFETEVTSLMIGLGIPISLGTILIWEKFLPF